MEIQEIIDKYYNSDLTIVELSEEDELKIKSLHEKLSIILKSVTQKDTTDYCTCDFVMIQRSKETDIAYCFDCKKQVKE